ncbi:hypothetical protein [Halobellus clavatus]|nr:hypothetical protein [Halobellus clavatus]
MTTRTADHPKSFVPMCPAWAYPSFGIDPTAPGGFDDDELRTVVRR